MYYKVHMLYQSPTFSSKPRNGEPWLSAFEDHPQFQFGRGAPDRRSRTGVQAASLCRFPEWKPNCFHLFTCCAFHDWNLRLRSVVTFSRFCSIIDGKEAPATSAWCSLRREPRVDFDFCASAFQLGPAWHLSVPGAAVISSSASQQSASGPIQVWQPRGAAVNLHASKLRIEKPSWGLALEAAVLSTAAAPQHAQTLGRGPRERTASAGAASIHRAGAWA